MGFWGVPAAHAQRLAEGAIRGWVRNESGTAVGTALITLRDRLTGAGTTLESARSGEFLFRLVAAGEYDLMVEAFGHRPLRVERVQVRGGETTRVDAVLRASGNELTVVDVQYFTAPAGGTSGRFTAADLGRYPWSGRSVGAVARLTSNADATLGSEGLPGSMTGLYVNGLPVGNPIPHAGAAGTPSFPLTAFRQAEFLTTSADVEWSLGAAPGLSAQTMTAPSRLEVRTFGDWTTGPAETSPLRAPVHSGLQAGAILSGPLITDTSSFVIGVETWRLETPIAFAARFDSIAAQVATVADEMYGRPDASVNRLSRSDAFSAFGRLDWRFGEGSTVSASAAITSLSRARSMPVLVDRVGAGSSLEGMDAFVSASLASRFSDRFGQEFRLGWDRGVRDFAEDDGRASTLFVNDALAVGADPTLVGRYATHTLRVRETLHYSLGEHFFKAGFSADLASHDHALIPQNRNVFWFSSADAFAIGSGYVVQTIGPSSVSFKLPRYGVFVQDEMSLASRFRLLLGARWDMDVLPLDDVNPHVEWFRLTGMLSDSAPSRHGRLSPRLEFEWRPDVAGRWSVRGAGGVWDAPSDPLLFGELLANDGRTRMYRSYGAFADWPNSSTQEGVPSLTILAPGFQGARSTRGALQISHRLSSAVELQFGGVLRRTEKLPRRIDLNRAAEPAGTDQYGRELYGSLAKQGAMITAEPGSNRRFAGFDVVSSINVDGWSEHQAFNVALNAQVASAWTLEARYTFSRTRDNWFMAREAAGTSAILPFDADERGDWTEATSDFDIPHRGLVGAEVRLPYLRGVRLAGLFRFQSGQPFTPGFRDGVDANADGSLRNDPAFLDSGVDGFGQLASNWDCIRENAGSFAPRNACRAGSASFLDARIAIGLFGSDNSRAELILDALNVISRGAAVPDHALYLVDATRPLEHAGTVTTVPLVVNPNFGAPLVRTTPGRMFRIGLSLKY